MLWWLAMFSVYVAASGHQQDPVPVTPGLMSVCGSCLPVCQALSALCSICLTSLNK